MEVQFAPNSFDEPNLLFKLQRKIKVFGTNDSLGNRGYNLVASSSKYGIVFVASPDGVLSSYYLKDLVDKECEAKSFKLKLSEKPTHIAVSCDHEFLAVTGGKMLVIYKIQDFKNMNVSPVLDLLTSVRNELNSFVSALTWNPCIPDTIAMALYDGTLIVSQVSNSQTKKIQSKARCICWSPKGKQLVVGNSDGTLCQYKPDLSPMKTIPAPDLCEGCPVEAMAIYWISTFQFAVIFKNATNNSRPVVAIVNTPKGGQPTCVNYEDICYSLGSNRPWYYYLQGIAQWNLILASSSNSIEIASLGSTDGANWLQWCQTDEARPELPLTDKKQENYPVGISIDTCAVHQLPWGENQTLPHMPLLHVVSQTGLLTVFNIINLNNQTAQVCSPPQPFNLPANALTSDIPGEVAAPVQAAVQAPAAAIAQKPQPVPSQPPQEHSISNQFGANAFESSSTNPKPFGIATTQAAPPTYTSSAVTSQVPLQKPQAQQQEVKPVVTPIPQPQVLQKPQPTPSPLSATLQTQTPEMKAALKAEQESANKIKMEQELKSMLVKEINDFQIELYKFKVETREMQLQLQYDLSTMEPIVDLACLDRDKLMKDCSMEELKSAVMNLKLELVRACGVVAEARTHSEVKDLQEWTQTDPLTMKRVSSIKNLSYYVQSQLERAQKALDFKWSELAFLRDQRYSKPGQRMIRPILDDVYQPLVKQQEILSRQQAVLKTLKRTLKDCNLDPVFKSTSILRSTPFRKDPLSKLTKNILNMSIEPETKVKSSLTPQKLDALRDMLANHKPNKIKPANIEITQHLTAMRLSYQRSMRDQTQQSSMAECRPQVETLPVKSEANIQPTRLVQPPTSFRPQGPQIQGVAQPVPTMMPLMSHDKKPEIVTPQPVLNIPTFTPVSVSKPNVLGLNNVARTLFTDEVSKEMSKPSQPLPMPQAFTPKPLSQPAQSAEVRSALRSILQEKQNNTTTYSQADKNDTNTFMGQKICSPTAFGVQPHQATSQSNVSTSKPISDLSNMFNKFAPQSFAADPKLPTSTPRVVKAEEPSITKPIDVKPKEEKQMTNLFGLKSPTNQSTIAKTILEQPKPFTSPTVQEEIKTEEKIAVKPKEPVVNVAEKVVKENVPEEKFGPDKENDSKTLGVVQSGNKSSIFGANSATSLSSLSDSAGETAKPKEVLPETTPTSDPVKQSEAPKSPTSPTASSLFASANATTSKPQSLFGPPTTPTTQSSSIFASSPTTSPASSLFASAAASSPPTQPPSSSSSPSVASTKTTQAGSIFASAAASTTSAFGTTQSLFGTAAKPEEGQTPSSVSSVFGTTQSAFGSPVTTTPQTTAQSIFATASMTTQSVFGTTTSTTQSSFAAQPAFAAATTTQSSIFGSPTPTTQSSIFASTTQSVFGSSAAQSAFGTATTTHSSIFASSTQSSPQSVFGSQAQTTQASSVFGGQNASVFGTPATTAQSGSLFGSSESSLFASASISTTSASSPTSGGSIFGGGSSGSVFGGNGTSGGNVFGSKSTFGQSSQSPASIFGGANQSSTFGQKQEPPAQNLWAGGQQGSGFGSSVFGQTATTQASSVFGGTTGGSFSSQGSAFGSPQQTSTYGAAGGDAKPSVFGSPPPQQTGFGQSTGFGAAPAFGQTSGFGAATTGSGFGSFGGFNKSPSSGFGSSATFGGGASFGAPGFGNTSPGKVFGGSSAPAPNFASPNQSSNATFESLATQNTVTFGNLAQQSGPPPAQPAPTFNTSPSFSGWRS